MPEEAVAPSQEQAPSEITPESTPQEPTDQAETPQDADPSGQPSAPELDLERIPEEYREAVKKLQSERMMQSDYTKKSQELARQRQEFERSSQDLSERSRVLDELLKDPKKAIAEFQAILDSGYQAPDPLAQRLEQAESYINSQRAEAQLTQFGASHPDLEKYADSMAPLVAKGYGLEDAYKIAKFEDVRQEAIEEGAKKAKQRDGAAAMPSAPGATSLPKNASMWEIFQESKRELEGK